MYKINSKGISAVIAAGGFASRMGGGTPKSLIKVMGKTLLEYTIDAATRAGISELLIFNNRPEYNKDITSILRKYQNYKLINDAGVVSTFELAIEGALRASAPNVCFMYGHAPRSVSHLSKLIKMCGCNISVTSVTTTTKTIPLKIKNTFIEPPYLIPSKDILSSIYFDWESYLTNVTSKIKYVKSDGPCEANSITDMIKYREYLYHNKLQFCGL